jgi:hypothetical protein
MAFVYFRIVSKDLPNIAHYEEVVAICFKYIELLKERTRPAFWLTLTR